MVLASLFIFYKLCYKDKLSTAQICKATSIWEFPVNAIAKELYTHLMLSTIANTES